MSRDDAWDPSDGDPLRLPLSEAINSMRDRYERIFDIATWRFGDLIEDLNASPTDPTRYGYFVRRLSPLGETVASAAEVTDRCGRFWVLPSSRARINVPRLGEAMAHVPFIAMLDIVTAVATLAPMENEPTDVVRALWEKIDAALLRLGEE